jgi:hypothetical protein
MPLLTDKPEEMILLTPEQHQAVMLNVATRLVWFNVNGSFVGPYVESPKPRHDLCR